RGTTARLGHPRHLLYSDLVYVAVVVLAASGSGHLFRGNNTPLKRLTPDVLKLDSRVADVKVILENMIQVHQNARTLRWRDVGDLHVASQRSRLRSQAPHMQVVYIHN